MSESSVGCGIDVADVADEGDSEPQEAPRPFYLTFSKDEDWCPSASADEVSVDLSDYASVRFRLTIGGTPPHFVVTVQGDLDTELTYDIHIDNADVDMVNDDTGERRYTVRFDELTGDNSDQPQRLDRTKVLRMGLRVGIGRAFDYRIDNFELVFAEQVEVAVGAAGSGGAGGAAALDE